MRSDVVQAINDLIRSDGDKTQRPTISMPGFKIDDIYPIFKYYFNAEAIKALETPAQGGLHVRQRIIITPGLGNLLKKLGLKSCQNYGEGLAITQVDKVCFCTSLADKANVYKAVEKVIIAVNDLASRGYITASQMALGVMAVTRLDQVEPDYIVMSYIALTTDGEQYAMANMPKMFVIADGMLPERFDNQ